MPAPTRLVVAAAVLAVSLTAALAFESVYHISFAPRATAPMRSAAEDVSEAPLALRLVDSGGVGVPLAGWGHDYAHDRRVFRDVILEQPPYVDTAAFRHVEEEWRAYVDRMLEYGNNAIAVPLFLELVDFARLDPSRGAAVYDADGPFRARHAAVRRLFDPLFEWTRARGMNVLLDTDMLALTPPLSARLRRLAPTADAAGIDTSSSAVWEVYRAGLEELFDTMPAIGGVVIRFGEGGALYNTEGWPYRSEMAVRTPESLRAMLRGLLPLFEAKQKTLVLRSWTVGVGRLGRLHVDPHVYEAVLGDIDSPALVVSTKFTAGDFFSYPPLNPTLATGRHRRLVELQAKPEFEGFGAFPNFLGHEHARALRALRSANPRIVGTYVMPQFGGPLRAGPRLLYPLSGPWLWTDANVFVASRLAVDPRADVALLATRWAEMRFGSDRRIVEAVVSVLMSTRQAVLDGFYIRPYAMRDVRVPGLELPPLMWIFEWDMIGGWNSLLSLVYQGSRDGIEAAIRQGHEAADIVRRARGQLQTAFEIGGPGACTQICDDALRSLEYQETLFELLAAWRQTFLSYYRWLDTADADAWREWRAGRQRFDLAARAHTAAFGNDPSFPAFDVTSATRAVAAAEHASWTRALSAALLAILLALIALGHTSARLAWSATTRPSQIADERIDVGTVVSIGVAVLLLIGFIVGALTAWTSAAVVVGSMSLVAAVALVFESTAIGGPPSARGRSMVTFSGALVPFVIVSLGAIAYFNALGVWFSFWTSAPFRVAAVTAVIATALWVPTVAVAARAREGWRVAVGSVLAMAGTALVVLTVTLPGWADVLRSLDRPLNVAPATSTMVFALRTYAGVSLDIGGTSAAVGLVLLALGSALCATNRPRRAGLGRLTPRASEPAPRLGPDEPPDRTADSR